jgi:hypothetical protein
MGKVIEPTRLTSSSNLLHSAGVSPSIDVSHIFSVSKEAAVIRRLAASVSSASYQVWFNLSKANSFVRNCIYR